MDDVFAIIFLLTLCGVFFVLPVWFLFKHLKKSRAKTEIARKAYKELPEEVKAENKRQGMINMARILGLVSGVLIGSRIFGNIVIGIVLGVVFAGVAQLLAETMIKKA